MARGVRKTPLEKLQLGLSDVRASITQYENCLDAMREKETSILNQIELEEYRELKGILDEQRMSINDIKELVKEQKNTQQSA